MRLFLLTMTQERLSDISEMLSNIYPVFDGVVAVVNEPSNDGTREFLEKNKGLGKVISARWTNHHGFLMNHLFFYGGLKNGDWCLYLDSPERITNDFSLKIRGMIANFEKDGVEALYWDNRPYLFKYSEYLEFHNAVHWGIFGFLGKCISNNDKSAFIVNTRDKKPEISYCLNPIKYWLCYPLGNEVQAMYGKYGQNVVNKHENIRRKFRGHLRSISVDVYNLSGIISYMDLVNQRRVRTDPFFDHVVETEFRMSELFQLKVLGLDFMTQMHPRFKWSFKDHMEYGNGWFNKEYIGVILKYDKGIF